MLSLGFFQNSNILLETIKYLRGGGLFHKKNIEELLFSHPNYPSLLSLSDVLTHYKIDNYPIRLEENELDKLRELPLPFIAHIKKEASQEDFILVTKIGDNSISYISSQREKKEEFQDFYKNWTRIALLLFPNKESSLIETVTQKNKRIWQSTFKIILSLVLSMLLIIGLFQTYQLGGGLFLTLVILKILGVSISSVLLMREVGIGQDLVKHICKIGNSDCDTVLDNKETKLLGIISWAELGFIYFGFGVIFTILSQSLIPSLNILIILNVLTLLFIPYSLYYQKFIAKSWCVLCLFTLSLFILESIVLFSLHSGEISFSINTIVLASVSVLLPVLVIYLFKPNHIEVNQLEVENRILKRFKYNPEYFQLILKSQMKKEVASDISPVILGNEDAENEVIVITNPYCSPCSLAHEFINYYLERPNMFENIKFTILFSVGNNEQAEKYQVAQKIIQSFLKDKKQGIIAMDKWYKNKDFKNWISQFQDDENHITLSQDYLTKHQNFVISEQINFTPAVLFNGYILPQDFTIQDLKFFLDK